MTAQKKLKALLVDDEKQLCDIMQFRLNHGGLETVAAHDTNEAKEILAKESFDIVISDFYMPNGGGPNLLSWLDSEFEEPPKLILLSGSLELPLADLYEKGVEAVFTKPLDFEAVIQLCRTVCEPERKRLAGHRFEVKDQDRIQLKVDTTGDLAQASLANIGKGGLFYQTNERLPEIDSSIYFELQIELSSQKLKGRGRVAWTREEADETGPRGVGLQFTGFEANSDELFFKFLNGLKTNQYIPKK